MGQVLSSLGAGGKYQIILDADGEILQSPGRPGINYESPNHVLHLQVLDWRKSSRSFSLELVTRVPDESEFQFVADYESDIIHFWFKLHRDYQGGRQELLRRTRRLFKEDNPLGISQILLGSEELAATLAALRRAHNRKNNWQPAVVRYGCRSTWLKRREAVDRLYYKFEVDKEETSLFIVDPSNEEYRAMVGGKEEKFFLVMTIPIRIWMCTVLATRTFNQMKERPSLDGLLQKLLVVNENADQYDEDKQERNRQMLLLLRRCMEERTMERSAATQEVRERADNEHKSTVTQSGTSGSGASMGPDAAAQEAEASVASASKRTLKRKKQKERKRMLREEQLREEVERLAALYEAYEENDVRSHELAGVSERLVDPVVETTEEITFTVDPPSPSPPSASPPTQSLQQPPSPSQFSSFSDVFPSPTFHTPPPTMRSTSCPPPVRSSPSDFISPFVARLQMESLAMPMDTVVYRTPRHTFPAVPDFESYEISTGEINEPGSPASNTNQTQSPAIENKTTCPQTQTLMLSERQVSRPVPAVSLPLRGNAEVFEPRVPVQTGNQDANHSNSGDSQTTVKASIRPVSDQPGQQDDNPPNSGDSQTTIQASTQSVPRKKGKKSKSKPKRKKPGKSSTRKRSADKGPSNNQEQHVDDDESRKNEVAAQDTAVTDAASQRPSQPTHEPSSSNLAPSFTQKTRKDKGKERVSEITTPEPAHSQRGIAQSSTSSDIQSCPEDALPTRGATAIPRAPAFSTLALTELEFPEACAEFWAPVKPATNPDKGESSKMAVTRAKTPSSRTVVPAVPILRGESTRTTSAKTPSSQAAAPAGAQKGDVSSSRIAKAKTPGPSTAVPAGSKEVESAQGAYPAKTPGDKTAVPAGPSSGNELAAPTSITDRGAETSRAHAHEPTSESRAAMNLHPVPENKPRDFWYDFTFHGFTCELPECDKPCTQWDKNCVVCPACGPYSSSIYCCKEHMRLDVKRHWTICGQLGFEYPCVRSSVPDRSLVGPPEIRPVHGWSTPEHHRQAMYFCTARDEGDYFIFAEYNEQMSANVPLAQNADWRCSPRVLFTVNFTCEEEKDRFRRILAACLMMSLEFQPLVVYLFQMIRDWFRVRGEWSNWMDGMLKYQFRLEFGLELTWDDAGERHACPGEWSRNLRHCRDPTCLRERSHRAFDHAVCCGLRGLCHALEANHWLLRAHRATHPTVNGVEARTRGQGFDDVLPEDRRLFRRGEGWDGFRTGPMELEESLTGRAYTHP